MSAFSTTRGMDPTIRRLVAWASIGAPALHTLTDAVEWIQGGFSPSQLWLNYVAFLPVPAIMIGLWAAQRPHIGLAGLAGAIGYGFAFVYFAHTTLLAIADAVPTYDALWERAGLTYTLHGAVMVAGGAAFGMASLRARVLPAWTAALFTLGVAANLVLALLPVPDLLQTAGTALRNAGLVSMGWSLLATRWMRREA